MSTQEPSILSIADFLVVLIRRKFVFLFVFAVVLGLAAAYALLARKTYELTGTVCVGKFQGDLLEEGEFVAQRLEDYSFIKQAVQSAGIEVDISVNRLQKLIKTEVVNEVKKTKDVGLVQLNVRYKDQRKVVDIFKALTDKLIAEHRVLLDASVAVLKDEETEYRDLQAKVVDAIEKDEEFSRTNLENPGQRTIPSLLLLEHTVSEKRMFRSNLTKDIHEVRVEAEAATSSYNSKLAAQPEIPDAHLKPKLTLTLVLGTVVAGMLALAAAFLVNLYFDEVRPKLRGGS